MIPKFNHFAVLFTLVLCTCGPAFQPKQARFVVDEGESKALSSNHRVAWEVRGEPVLSRGPDGEWDSVDTLNPSVFKVGGTFYNLYSGFDGKAWHTGLATSRDAINWEKQGTDPIISPNPESWEGDYIAANGSLYHDGERFLYWYQAGRRGGTSIGVAFSVDARHWSKHVGPVLSSGSSRSWDETAVGDPYVIRSQGSYYMYYLGQTRFGVQRLGVARSADGIHFQKSHSNPILETGPPGSFDERGLGEPAVFRVGGRYFMLYTGRDRDEKRRIGWAESVNGVDWEKSEIAPMLEGSQPWNNEVVCDPSVWKQPGQALVWFGGGDRASPDENLNGQIGFAVLRLRRSE